MLSLIATLVIAPVQDRAISVAEFIKSFDSETIKHVASKEMGEHIIFVHAPNQRAEEIKAKLAEALSASWRKTETGFRLERTQRERNSLEKSEADDRARIFEEFQTTVRKTLQENTTAEQRANSALKSLLALQEKYRTSRPTAFKPETELPADWLLSALIDKLKPHEIASVAFGEGIQRSDKPAGAQLALEPGFQSAIAAYLRDRREVYDFADTILSQTANGPMSEWIAKQIDGIRKPEQIDRVLFQFGRGSLEFFLGVFIYNTAGEIFESTSIWVPMIAGVIRLEIPTALTAELDDVQYAFVSPTYGYAFIRNPQPQGIEKIMGVEPLCAVEPLFTKIAGTKGKPTIAVLDDRLLSAATAVGGQLKNVSDFVRRAEDEGSLSILQDESWLVLRPRYLLDTAARRFDRTSIQPFLESTKRAGCETIESHILIIAATPYSYIPLPLPIFTQSDKSGYVLVKETNQYLPVASRATNEILKLRGGVPKETFELPVASLPSAAKSEILKWARGGAATMQARPGQTPSSLELNGNFAVPNGLRADSIIRVVPSLEGCVGLKEPFPNSYTAEELGWMCAGMQKPPAEVVTAPLWYGQRRKLRVEILLTPKAMLSNEYYESASEMKEMRGYESLPENFRKEVEKAYEEMRKTLNRG